MEQDEKDLLEKTYEMSKENNHILKGIRASNRWASFIRVIYWILIIGASLVAYYFVKPYVAPMLKAFGELQKGLNNVQSVIKSIPSLPKTN